MDDETGPRRRARKVSDDELLAAAADATNMRQLLCALGIAAYGGNYDSIRRRLERLGSLDACFAPRPRVRVAPSGEELAAAAASSRSVTGLFRLLDLPLSGSAHAAMVRGLREAGIDTSHFLGQRANAGRRFPGRSRPLSEILVAGQPYSTDVLRRRLVEEGVLEPACACCGRTTWNGRSIPLELDHINGDRTDNRLENLRLLCPNCHAQTDTYRGRNVGRAPQGAGALPSTPNVAFDGRTRLAVVMGLAG